MKLSCLPSSFKIHKQPTLRSLAVTDQIAYKGNLSFEFVSFSEIRSGEHNVEPMYAFWVSQNRSRSSSSRLHHFVSLRCLPSCFTGFPCYIITWQAMHSKFELTCLLLLPLHLLSHIKYYFCIRNPRPTWPFILATSWLKYWNVIGWMVDWNSLW